MGTGVQVDVGNAVIVAVAVGGSVEVLVGTLVAVAVAVAVGNSGTTVVPGTGVRVGTLGTHSLCPA